LKDVIVTGFALVTFSLFHVVLLSYKTRLSVIFNNVSKQLISCFGLY